MRLVVPGRPVPASRPRVTRGKMTADGRWVKPHAYYTKRYAKWLADAAKVAASTGERFDGPVRVCVVVCRSAVEIEVSASPVERPSGVRGDLDNLGVKGVLDALQRGGLLANDSQVVELSVRFG